MRRAYLPSSFVICACLSLPLSAHATDAKPVLPTTYDGIYSINVITEDGPCDKAYQGSVTITDGQVTAISQPMATASGLVEDDGTISLTFRQNEQVAHVGGKIRGRHGSGAWSSPTAQCGGIWRAERQGWRQSTR